MTKYKDKLVTSGLVMFFVLMMVGNAVAGSLWNDAGSAYETKKARKVGDLVTVFIDEETQATQTATTNATKDSSVSSSANVPALGSGSLSVSGGDKYSAKGTTLRNGTISAKITVQVTEVLPNGNLRIEGKQEINLNKEKQNIIFAGIIRPEDISIDNTILSQSVADARIEIVGEGSVGDKQKPGVLTRLLNWLF